MDPFGIFEDVPKGSGIQIYTDSKERVPSMDDNEANPFLTRNGGAKAGKAKSKKRTQQERQMEEAVRNEEGMVYVL